MFVKIINNGTSKSTVGYDYLKPINLKVRKI